MIGRKDVRPVPGRYEIVVPLSSMTGIARFVLEYWLFPAWFVTEIPDRATVKDEMSPL